MDLRKKMLSYSDIHNTIYFIFLVSLVFGLILILAICNKIDANKGEMTAEKAKYEYCLLVTQLKYPTSSTDIVKRLCELEQIGRLSVQ